MLTNEGWNNSQLYNEDMKEKDKKCGKPEHKDEKCDYDPCKIKESCKSDRSHVVL